MPEETFRTGAVSHHSVCILVYPLLLEIRLLVELLAKAFGIVLFNYLPDVLQLRCSHASRIPHVHLRSDPRKPFHADRVRILLQHSIPEIVIHLLPGKLGIQRPGIARIPEHVLRLRLLPVACQFLPADAVLADVLQLLLHGEFHARQLVCNADPVLLPCVPDHAQPRVLCPRHQVRWGARRGQKRDCLIKANHALRLGLKVRGRDLLCLLEQLLNLHRRRSVNVVFFRRHPLADAL